MARELRPNRRVRVGPWPFVLAFALVGAAATAQSGSVVRIQDPDAQARSAVLRAMVVLKIAPYLTPVAARKHKPSGKYRIALVGTDPVADVAPRHLPGKKVDDASVTVLAVAADAAASAEAADTYDLLYIAASVDDATLLRIVANHADKPVVLVCERPRFAELGGGVQLFVRDNCVRFEVNGTALRKQGLQPSPQLLKLSCKGPS